MKSKLKWILPLPNQKEVIINDKARKYQIVTDKFSSESVSSANQKRWWTLGACPCMQKKMYNRYPACTAVAQSRRVEG